MTNQNFKNHRRIHPIYHYFVVPVSLVLILAAIFNLWMQLSITNGLLLIVAVFIHLIAFLTREYAKKNQDRIIHSEFRLRYFLLSGKNADSRETELSTAQILALRFAPDDEFINLMEDKKTTTLSPVQIKQSIKNWKADNMRV
ncbi:MAG: hypothetical protein JNL60_15555 [Bacteroidia bacterium]|nr:hypothetical protein [Bacteroidia bacterium]